MKMSDCLESMGLEFFREDEDSSMALLHFVAKEGKSINGYYDYPYINCALGNVDLILNTKRTKAGLETTVLDTQSAGMCVWEVKIVLDITPSEYEVTQKRLLVSTKDDTHNVVIEVVNADVLPSFLPGDTIKLQVVAFAQYIDYDKDEDEYTKNWPGNYMIADGSVIPSQFFFNHDVGVDESKKDYSNDNVILIRGTVKIFYDGEISIEGKKEKSYIRCFIDTHLGELELIHTLKQVNKEQYKNLCAGSVVSGGFILSGDAAIYEYEKGIIRDERHNLKLLQYTFAGGDPQRLTSVLSENVEYNSEITGKCITGKDKVIEHIKYVQDNISHKYFAYLAEISDTDDNAKNKKCIVLASDQENNYESLVFIEQNDNNHIKKLSINNFQNYKFIIDNSDVQYR